MRQLYILSIISLILCSCQKDPAANASTSVGGEIVNSNTPYLTLERNGKLVDSISIEEDGTFTYNFEEDNFEPGLYTFRHNPEGQVFFIEEGDSLLFRVNTKEFDESLMFTGDKSAENNFLMEMYLLNEKDNDVILSYYKTSPEKFIAKTGSIKAKRKEKLAELKSENNFSDAFIELADKTIDYEYYDLRERYAFLINTYFKSFFAFCIVFKGR